MSALTRPHCRWRAFRSTRGELRDSTTDAGERARPPEPSSNRMQMDSTWDEMERSGDGPPSVERQSWRNSVVVPRTPSNPRRWVTPRPDFPAQYRRLSEIPESAKLISVHPKGVAPQLLLSVLVCDVATMNAVDARH